MKYEYYPKRRTEQERRELNEQILRLLQSEACEQAGVTDEDTTDYDRPVGGIEWREGISSGSISYGLEIVDIEGLEQQGLQICYLAPQEIAGQKNFKTRTIYWDCGVWRVCQ